MIQFTNIKGEPLPEDINKVANERIDSLMLEYKDITLKQAFIWQFSIEKEDIWNSVYEGNYEPFREFHKNK